MTVNADTVVILDGARADLALTINGTLGPIAQSYADLVDRTTSQLRQILVAEAQTADGVLSLATMIEKERVESVISASLVELQAQAAAGQVTLVNTVTNDIVPMAQQYELDAIQSQLDPLYQGYGNTINRTTLTTVVERSALRAEYLAGVPQQTIDAIERALIDGVALGVNPRIAAQRLMREVGGLLRAAGIDALRFLRTEMLDAYRNADALTRTANSDVVVGWWWMSAADTRTCPSCWAMHGTQFPVDAIGPDDHMNGRCVAVPIVRTDLSRGIPPPPSRDALWARLSEAQKRSILGPTRYDLFRSGRIGWRDMTRQYPAGNWRQYRSSPTVAELRERVASFPCPVVF